MFAMTIRGKLSFASQKSNFLVSILCVHQTFKWLVKWSHLNPSTHTHTRTRARTHTRTRAFTSGQLSRILGPAANTFFHILNEGEGEMRSRREREFLSILKRKYILLWKERITNYGYCPSVLHKKNFLISGVWFLSFGYFVFLASPRFVVVFHVRHVRRHHFPRNQVSLHPLAPRKKSLSAASHLFESIFNWPLLPSPICYNRIWFPFCLYYISSIVLCFVNFWFSPWFWLISLSSHALSILPEKENP